MKSAKKVVIRQGDVSLIGVDALPKGATEVKNDEGKRVVLAYGEVTGHAHAIYEQTDQVRVWAVGKVKYLEVMANAMTIAKEEEFVKKGAEYEEITGQFDEEGNPIFRLVSETEFFPAGTELLGVMLRHEEHTHARIEPGIYKLPVQVEYTPQELRRTAD